MSWILWAIFVLWGIPGLYFGFLMGRKKTFSWTHWKAAFKLVKEDWIILVIVPFIFYTGVIYWTIRIFNRDLADKFLRKTK